MCTIDPTVMFAASMDLLYTVETLLKACAKTVYGMLPVYVTIDDDCFTHVRIADDVYACKLDGGKCKHYACVKRMSAILIAKKIMSCSTHDACSFYQSCMFKNELKQAVELYELIEKIWTGSSVDENIDIDDIITRANELKSFARIVEHML